ncbi:MAG: UrcA family protein [Parcubacteria group bacterium]
MKIHRIVASAALAAALFSNASAMDREPTEVHVSMVGVDFAQPASVKAFYARLRAAAHKACDSHMAQDLGAIQADRRCAAESLDRAVAKIDQPTLLALHTQQTGRTSATMLAAN